MRPTCAQAAAHVAARRGRANVLGVMALLPKTGGELRAGSAGSSLLFLALLECCFSTLLFCLRSLSTWTVLGNSYPGLDPPSPTQHPPTTPPTPLVEKPRLRTTSYRKTCLLCVSGVLANKKPIPLDLFAVPRRRGPESCRANSDVFEEAAHTRRQFVGKSD